MQINHNANYSYHIEVLAREAVIYKEFSQLQHKNNGNSEKIKRNEN